MKTQAVFVTPYRRRARKVERELQAYADGDRSGPPGDVPFPEWAKGARVEHVGWFSWIVTATEERGH